MTLVSGNTCGAKVWTDGKRVFPMFPSPPAVVKCRYCAECYWLKEAKKIGSIDFQQNEDQQTLPEWAAAQVVEEPCEEDYYLAIKNGLATSPEQERTLRILAWWRRNDSFREVSQKQNYGTLSIPEPHRKNLENRENMLFGKDVAPWYDFVLLRDHQSINAQA